MDNDYEYVGDDNDVVENNVKDTDVKEDNDFVDDADAGMNVSDEDEDDDDNDDGLIMMVMMIMKVMMMRRGMTIKLLKFTVLLCICI